MLIQKTSRFLIRQILSSGMYRLGVIPISFVLWHMHVNYTTFLWINQYYISLQTLTKNRQYKCVSVIFLCTMYSALRQILCCCAYYWQLSRNILAIEYNIRSYRGVTYKIVITVSNKHCIRLLLVSNSIRMN